MYSVLNTLPEYPYFYISKNITSLLHTLFCLFLKSSEAFSVSLIDKLLFQKNSVIAKQTRQYFTSSRIIYVFDQGNMQSWSCYGQNVEDCLHFVRWKLKSTESQVFKYFAKLKGAFSGPRQFLANESPLKMMKNTFLFHLRSSFYF